MLINDMLQLNMDPDLSLCDDERCAIYERGFDSAVQHKDNRMMYNQIAELIIDEMKHYDYVNWNAMMTGVELGLDYYNKLVNEITIALMSGNTKKYKDIVTRVRKECEGRITKKTLKAKSNSVFWSNDNKIDENEKYHTWKVSGGNIDDFKRETTNHAKVVHLNADIIKRLELMTQKATEILRSDNKNRTLRTIKLNNQINKQQVQQVDKAYINDYELLNKTSKALGMSLSDLKDKDAT